MTRSQKSQEIGRTLKTTRSRKSQEKWQDAEGDSFSKTSGGSSKDAEDNSFSEILGRFIG